MKTCKDFEWTGVECCPGCHYELDHEDELQRGFDLITIKVDGELVKVCCELAEFFYPRHIVALPHFTRRPVKS
jgi:hypothetical protein